ncbi:MAG: hypothetical protein RLZZ381_1234 [Cyanobacteriota bacterium]|jgi:hypothetical protein
MEELLELRRYLEEKNYDKAIILYRSFQQRGLISSPFE